jgi:ribosomal protein S18 acetylase RimI-like enzyme
MDIVVREARENELDEIGAVTAAAYDGLVPPDYLDVLRDARARWEYPATALLVALDGGTDGILGAVAYVTSGSPLQELAAGDEAEFRMLGVLESARGRGIGEALVLACVARARAEGRPRLVLSTGDDLKAAHRLYERLGFGRATHRDWSPVPSVDLLAYSLDLA